MIWFWIVAGLLVLCALLALLRPLLRAAAESSDRGESVVEVFRRELANVENELAHGRLAADQAEAARADVTRRMIAAADKESQEAGRDIRRDRATSWRMGAVAGIAALLPAASLALYTAVGTPAAIGP
ncbi:MAG: c-type cytochrome biogenesis protein CcmI, partial [Alphaproteobacteria bacterium]|nr:c-type cytochrome biogenesis protein CcmI [Alphaproteobacteria bacterium]